MSAFTLLLLGFAGFFAWGLSTIAGGGGAMLLVPIIGVLTGAELVAPIVTMTTLVASGGRLVTFGQSIEWRVVKWALPGAILGGFMGASLISNVDEELISLCLALFLLSAPVQMKLGKARPQTRNKYWHFLPAQLLVGLVSGVVGAVGPVLNSLYLNAGIDRARMVGTKTLISTPMQLTKLATYTAFGALSGEVLLFSACAGLGALLSNRFAKRLLDRMSRQHFQHIIVCAMIASGCVMLYHAIRA